MIARRISDIALVVAALAMVWAPAGAPAETSVLVVTAPLVKMRLAETIVAYGPILADPDTETSITVSRSGLVNRMQVRSGAAVKAGDALFEFETDPIARMQYIQAQAALIFARRELARVKRLVKERLATNAQLDTATQALARAQTDLDAQKKTGASETREIVRAPFDGIVTNLFVKNGARVQANTTVLIVARRTQLIVLLGIEAEDVSRIKTGASVTLTAVLTPTTQIQSKIDRIHAMINPLTRLVDALVRVTQASEHRLVLGTMMRGSITITQGTTFAVSRSAVLRDDQGAYVFVVKDGRARRVAVRSGIHQADLVGVAGNLRAGDKIVTSGNYELSDGMLVRERRP